MKEAVIYDRWLHSLGGGEVVACNIARILQDSGYKVLFISGKKVSKEIIFEKLHINVSDIEFVQVWNDEHLLKKLTSGKEFFINISFMDYSRGFAKRNIYFVNFPTRQYTNLKGLIFSLLAPWLNHFIKPIESMQLIDAPVVIKGLPAYILGKKNKYAIYNLRMKKVQIIEFSLLIENFSKTQLEKISVYLENAEQVDKTISVIHENNILKFVLKFIPKSNTAYLNINICNFGKNTDEIEAGGVFLLYPKIKLRKLSTFLFSDYLEKFQVRIRAGVFTNILDRLSTYQIILTYSVFAQKWIRKYWKRNSVIIAPPVALIFEDYDLSKYKKRNWICSVGRFFTLGHGKKQEVMIAGFKKIYDKGYKSWELHLVGGLGNEPSSLEFFQYLKEESEGYPIYFHINVSRKEVEEIYLKSKIYWHATGFGEDENYQPVRFEHFGIAPIEAISAGCIPILFKGGGLTEIIDAILLKRDMYTFDSINSLVELTISHMAIKKNDIPWEKIFKILKNNYSKEAFKEKFLKVIN